MIKSSFTSLVTTFFLTIFLLLITQVSFAQVRSSTNYQLQSDSINVGGGLASSTNYTQESTVGEVATGVGTSANYELRAGYQQMQEVFISISASGDVNLSPQVTGLNGGTANGSTTVTVITDSPAGYSLTLKSSDNPAMRIGSSTIADYNEGADPDFSFAVSSGQAFFGFSPSSVDVTAAFSDNGSLCNTGSLNTPQACWAGLSSTTGDVIALDNSPNHPSGATTTIYFRVGVGSGASIVAGTYTATTTLTALPL